MQVRSKRKSTLIGNPFEQRAEDAKIFSGYHVGVKLCQFPKMRHISRKDLLGKQFSLMQKRYGTKDFSFHPMTYVLPEDYKNLVKIMAARYVQSISKLFRNMRFALNKMFQRNASKFSILFY